MLSSHVGNETEIACGVSAGTEEPSGIGAGAVSAAMVFDEWRCKSRGNGDIDSDDPWLVTVAAMSD